MLAQNSILDPTLIGRSSDHRPVVLGPDVARPIRILVIGRPNVMRDGLLAILRIQERMEVLTALESDSETIRSVLVKPAPDIALMHFPMVTSSSLEAVAAVRRRWPTAGVIVLTCRLDDRIVSTAMEAGINGCVSESDSHLELLSAIRTVADGEHYLSLSMTAKDTSGPDNLTEREKEVTRLIAAGYRTREIAGRLSLSCKTIEKHRASVMRKLGLRSAAAVAAYATSHGHLIL
ncbi:MAG TPA: response regulator transcription factor [Steroidobacteraceae bacterium]